MRKVLKISLLISEGANNYGTISEGANNYGITLAGANKMRKFRGGENDLREIVKVRESLNINLREIIELD